MSTKEDRLRAGGGAASRGLAESIRATGKRTLNGFETVV
jgi:hypothetical protein